MYRPTVVDDEELARLALAADPDTEVAGDAIPMPELAGADRGGLLPDWYMPTPVGSGTLTGWRRVLALLVIAALVAIAAAGLCSTDGYVGLA